MSAPGNVRRRLVNSKDDWRTPPYLVKAIERYFGVWFTLDAAADHNNKICDAYLSGPHRDDLGCWCGLCASWQSTSFAWCNPPYSMTKLFVDKAIVEGTSRNASCLLVPAATDTQWWAKAYANADTTILLTGRVPFLDGETGETWYLDEQGNKKQSSNTTGSTLFFFGRDPLDTRKSGVWDWKQHIKP